MKYRVIEPHADDAFLSLGGHIKRWIANGDEVEIVTVYANQKRAAEAKAYADHVGASHSWLGLIEAGSLDGEPAAISALPTIDSLDLVAIGPLGLRHTEHHAVRKAFDNDPRYVANWYYVDQPYAMQLKNQPELNENLAGMTIESVFKPGGKKYDKKTVEIFKTQNMFFYFNKDMLPYTTEMIVSW